VLSSLGDVDVVLFVVEAGRFGLPDAKVLALLETEAMQSRLLVANKLDALPRRHDVLPWLKQMQERHAFAEYVPMSATRDADVERLLGIVEPYLPEQPWLYEEDALTDRSERFLAGELIREKLFRLTGDELPYNCTVVIDKFEEEQRTSAASPPRSSSSAMRTRAWSSAKVANASSASAARRARSWSGCGAPRSSSSCGSRCARAGPTTKRTCAAMATNEAPAGPGAALRPCWPTCCTSTTGARPA
jgi:hypothetical protein